MRDYEECTKILEGLGILSCTFGVNGEVQRDKDLQSLIDASTRYLTGIKIKISKGANLTNSEIENARLAATLIESNLK